jgi:serine/threonine protein phosphatase 1
MLLGRRMQKSARPAATRPSPSRPVQAPRPKTNSTVYAIGDIHGRLDLFEALLARIRQDVAQAAEPEPPTLILLGDLIDRGPDSKGCVDRAIALEGEGWCVAHALKGNHEEAILLFLEDHDVGPNWSQYGGDTTLKSYGVEISSAAYGRGWAGVRDSFLPNFPASHLDFMQRMKLWLEVDDYLFVHAGVRPGAPIEKQTATDLMWIRQDFLAVENPYPGKVVVHGHTPTREAQLRRWRIGIDTGAYATGLLTAIKLKGYERTLIQVSEASASQPAL